MSHANTSRPLDTYGTVREWRRSRSGAEGVYVELVNRIDAILPAGQSTIGDELRDALNLANYARLGGHRTWSEGTLVVVVELLARVESELEEDAVRSAELDAWYRSLYGEGGADA